MQPSVFPKELPVNKTGEKKTLVQHTATAWNQPFIFVFFPSFARRFLSLTSSRLMASVFFTLSSSLLLFSSQSNLPELLYFPVLWVKCKLHSLFSASSVPLLKMANVIFELNIAVSIFVVATSALIWKMASSFSRASFWLSDSINWNEPGLDIVSGHLDRSKANIMSFTGQRAACRSEQRPVAFNSILWRQTSVDQQFDQP